MTRRKRLLTVFDKGVPDRVPIGMDCWPETRKRIYAHYGAESHYDFYEKSSIDNFSLWDWPAAEPSYKGEPRPGVTDHTVSYGMWGAFGENPCPMKDYSSYKWPSVGDLDFSRVKEKMLEAHEYDMVSIAGHVSVGYTHHNRVRNMEQALLDVTDDAFMEDYMGRVREFYISYLKALFAAAERTIDIMRCDEDIGGNDTLVMSPAMWRKWYKPLWKEALGICHENGCRAWMHSCGYCRPLVEDFIEIGADVLDPIPPYVKDSDPLDMKRAFGDRLCLHGGVNHIDAMVYGTPAVVRDEVRLRMEQMKPGGAYICGASQVLTDQMPLDNIIAMFDAILEYGRY